MVPDIFVLSGDDSINACDCCCCISSFNSQTSRMSIFTGRAHNCWILISIDWWNDNKLVKSRLYCLAKKKIKNKKKPRLELYFCAPWKRQKTKSFLTFSRSTEMEHWAKIGLCVECCVECDQSYQCSRSNESILLYFLLIGTCSGLLVRFSKHQSQLHISAC